MVFSDWTIKILSKRRGLIRPFNERNVNSASYNLVTGNQITDAYGETINLKHGDEYPIFFGYPILGHSLEFINMPRWLSAKLYLRSTPARKQLQQATATWVDPMFRSGQITYELSNTSMVRPFIYKAGYCHLQIVFYFTIPCLTGYDETGRYNYQVGATQAR